MRRSGNYGFSGSSVSRYLIHYLFFKKSQFRQFLLKLKFYLNYLTQLGDPASSGVFSKKGQLILKLEFSARLSRSPIESPKQNLRQIGLGVHELWSDIHTNKQTNRQINIDYYFILI